VISGIAQDKLADQVRDLFHAAGLGELSLMPEEELHKALRRVLRVEVADGEHVWRLVTDQGSLEIGRTSVERFDDSHDDIERGYAAALAESLRPLGTGRPPGLTTIQDDEQLREPIREMRRDRIRPTQPTVAARSGFTVAEIRGYLTVTGRSWAEFLSSF
jgi:hypothetical protein